MRPILTVLAVIIALWYAACLPMNVREVLTGAERVGAVIMPPAAGDHIKKLPEPQGFKSQPGAPAGVVACTPVTTLM